MAPLTYAQLQGLWLKAAAGTQYDTPGFASLMAAVAEAESGGNPGAVNAKDNNGTQSSYGLWQISTGTHAPPSPNWADPATNAALAVSKLQSQGLGAWGTYGSGAYKAYLSPGTTPDLATPANPAAIDTAAAASSASDCLYGFSGIPGTSFLSDVFGNGGNVGQFCILTRSEARGAAGVALMTAGGLMLITGAAIAGLYAGLQHPGGAAGEKLLSKVPGVGSGPAKAASAPRRGTAPPGPPAPRAPYGTVPSRPPVVGPQGGPPRAGKAYGRRPYYPPARGGRRGQP